MLAILPKTKARDGGVDIIFNKEDKIRKWGSFYAYCFKILEQCSLLLLVSLIMGYLYHIMDSPLLFMRNQKNR